MSSGDRFALELTLYNGARTWVRATVSDGLIMPGTQLTQQLHEIQNPAVSPSNVYDVSLLPVYEETGDYYEGWATFRASLRINGGSTFWGHWKPLSVYAAEPTDWHSGIVRWVAPGYPQQNRPGSRGYLPATETARWTVTARRAE